MIGENMKALLMKSYNKAEMVNVMKITESDIENAKKKEIPLSKTVNDEYDIKQTLVFEECLKLRESSRQTNKRFESQQFIDINLNVGDVLTATELGYKVSLLPLKIITDKEERLIEKYNQIGK
jgi:hypothetical protein